MEKEEKVLTRVEKVEMKLEELAQAGDGIFACTPL